jgi:hypothetical protein
MTNKMLLSIVGVLALSLFLIGFDEGIRTYLGGLNWYFKIGLAFVLAYFVGKKLY